MPLSVEQEALCERLTNAADPDALAAVMLIRELAREIDQLWDRVSRTYREDLLHKQIQQLRAELSRAQEQLSRLSCREDNNSAHSLERDSSRTQPLEDIDLRGAGK
jgi:predicted RNase H-like nuclease (RuvC/YqgF family)